ncbi:hypothetical protein [Salegentibacter sp. T436]|jgi:hypothetical protein|uniref:hypothetical protein n=1 Tax=Salegentibacter sp. T436 TaxID=1729720 RepID=UPI00094A8E4E|nr:hypothetical protein [Salegentibacter sp. T436]APS40160.1 hypothetical protein AO058_15305 [Salegentibacter sp. T436]
MKLKIILILVFIILIIAIPFFNWKAHEIKGYTDDFESINHLILNNFENEHDLTEILLTSGMNNYPELLKAKEESELCSIKLYPDKGIVYKFQCKNNSSDNFFDSDDKFYLIKILNDQQRTKFLNYPQFVDYTKKPVYLNDNWFLIEQNISYD